MSSAIEKIPRYAGKDIGLRSPDQRQTSPALACHTIVEMSARDMIHARYIRFGLSPSPPGLMTSRSLRSFAFVAGLCSIAVRSSAQTADAAFLGLVTDTAGVPLPGVTMTARNAATVVEWTVVTNASGRYAFVQLPLGGPYTMSTRRVGFRPESRSGYELRLGSRAVVDFVLHSAATALPTVLVS